MSGATSSSFTTPALSGSTSYWVRVIDGGGNAVASNTATITVDALPSPPPSAIHYIAVGADAGGGPQVNIYNALTDALVASFYAFRPSFTGGVRVAVDDVNGDGTPDIICAAGPSTAPQVVVIDGTKLNQVQSNGEIASSAVLASFYAFAPTFSGAVYVAVGTSSSGQNWIVCGAGSGGGPQVVVFTAKAVLAGGTTSPPTPLTSFYAFNPSFTGGATVALGGVTGDGHLDILAAAGPGGGPQVIVVDGTKLSQIQSNGLPASSALLASFYAYAPDFTGGGYVASGDLGGTGAAEIVVGAGVGGGPQVNVYLEERGALAVMSAEDAFDPTLQSGVRVGVVTTPGSQALLTASGPGPQATVDIFSVATRSTIDSFFAFEPDYRGGVFVGGA